MLDIQYPSGNIAKKYDYEDDLFAQIDEPQSTAPDPHYFLYDGLGSTRSLTNHQGAIEQTYSYKPFGEANGFDPGAENQLTRNLFTSEQFDAETGYYHLRARQYDPSIGRFTSFDPAEDYSNRLHKYNYCLSNPISIRDPGGTFILADTVMASKISSFLTEMQLAVGQATYLVAQGALGRISAKQAMNELLIQAAFAAATVVAFYFVAKLASKLFSAKGAYAASPVRGSRFSKELLEEVANSSRNGVYTTLRLEEKQILYRIYGGKSGKESVWWGIQPYEVSAVAKRELALTKGNTATKMAIGYTEPGQEVAVSLIGEANGYPGNGLQVVVPDPLDVRIIKSGIPLK